MSRPENVWARSRRASKVSALVGWIDAEMGAAAHTAPAGVATWLRTLDREQWKTVATGAHCNPPTYRQGVSLTVEAVIDVYVGRAEKLQRRNPKPIIGKAL